MPDTVQIDIVANVSNAVSSMERLAKSIGGAYLSLEGFKRLVVDSMKEYLEAERAETKLATALRITGQYSEEALSSLKQYSEFLQMHTVFEHEATQGAAALLLQIGHLTTEGIQKAIPVLMDYASAMGIDLTTAATQFAQAIEGGRNIFQRYGISLKDATGPSEKFNTIIEGLTRNFGGMAEAIGKTTGGQLVIFKNQIKELKEQLGELEATLLLPGLRWINQSLSAGQIENIDLSKAGLGALKEYQATMSEFLKTLNDAMAGGKAHNIGSLRSQYDAAQQTLSAITQQIQRLEKAGGSKGKGAVVTAVLGDDPDAGIKYLFQAYSAISPMYGTGMTNASIRGNVSGGPALPMFGTGMTNVPQHLPGAGGMPGMGMENPGAYQLPEDWIRKQREELRDLEKQWREVGNAVVAFGEAIGGAIASGDWEGTIKSMGRQITSLIAQYAIAAAAAAAVAFNWPMAAFWLGVAGVAAIGGGFIGASGSATGQYTDANLPHYASGTDYVPRTGLAVVHKGEQIIPAGGRGGGTIIMNIYGWQGDQMARQVVREIRKW